jgi:hypothetical protein
MLHMLPISLFTHHTTVGNYYVLRSLDVFRSCKITQVHALALKLVDSSLKASLHCLLNTFVAAL